MDGLDKQELRPLPEKLSKIVKGKKSKAPKTAQRKQPDRASSSQALSKYASAALELEMERVSSAPKGTRNDALNRAAFSLGQLVATPGALRVIKDSSQTPDFFLDRHVRGDWGEVCDEDKLANDAALVHGERLLSAYKTLRGQRIWIVTEADRSSTCILLPEEY